jgi:hypothetical protein
VRPRVSSIAGLALLAAGCVSAPPLPRYPDATTPGEALAIFSRNQDGWRTLRASVDGNSDRGSFSGVLFADRAAGRFRLYAWKLGGAIAIFDLLVEDGALALYVPRAGRVLKRPLDPAASELDALFAAFFRAGTPAERCVENVRDSTYLVDEMAGGRVAARWVLDRPTLAPLAEELDGPDGAPRLTVVFADHRVVAGRVVPGRMTVRVPGRPDFALVFDEIALDEPLDAKRFAMRVPVGAIEVHDAKDLEPRAD